MKKYLIAIFTLSLACSCSYKVDKTDIFKVGEAIHESFARQDTSILKEIYQYQMDSISKEEKQNIKEIYKFFDKKTPLIKVDTFLIGPWSCGFISLFYQKGSNFYRLEAIFDKKSTDNLYYINDLSLTNLNDKCKEYNETPYKPKSGIEVKSISWDTDNIGKTFKSGSVELQNKFNEDITYIKFRVILKHGEYPWNAETFLSQTVESYKPISSGDITWIEIPGMKDYFIGFMIQKNKFSFEFELLDLKPKPESNWCADLEELKEFVLTNNEKK